MAEKGDTRQDIEKSMKASGADKIVKEQVEQLKKIKDGFSLTTSFGFTQ